MANIIPKSRIVNPLKNIPKLAGNRNKGITEEVKNKKSSLERSCVKVA